MVQLAILATRQARLIRVVVADQDYQRQTKAGQAVQALS
jgi:hypothetical protein